MQGRPVLCGQQQPGQSETQAILFHEHPCGAPARSRPAVPEESELRHEAVQAK
jgi:hypothetical protein